MNDTLVSVENARRAHDRLPRVTRMKILGDYAFEDFDRARSGAPLQLLVRTTRDTCPKGPEFFDNLDVGKLETVEVVIIRLDIASFKCLVGGSPAVILQVGPTRSAFWMIRLYDTA